MVLRVGLVTPEGTMIHLGPGWLMGRQCFTGEKARGVSNALVNGRSGSKCSSALDNNLEYDEWCQVSLEMTLLGSVEALNVYWLGREEVRCREQVALQMVRWKETVIV